MARFYLERGNYKAALRTVDTTVLEPIHNVGARATLGLTPGSDPFDGDAFDRTRLDYLRLAATTASSQQHLVADGSNDDGRRDGSPTGGAAPPGDGEGTGSASGHGGGAQQPEHGDYDEHDEYDFYDDEMFERLRFPPPAALLDATSVLWRLELNGIAASFRWLKLADHWECVAPGLGFGGGGGGGEGFDDLHLRYGQDHRRAAVWAYGEEASAASSAAAARQRALRRSHLQQQQGFTASSSSDSDSDSENPRPFSSFSTELIHQLTPLQAVHRTMNAVACAELLDHTAADDDDEYYEHEFAQEGGGSGGGYGSGLDDMIAPTPSIFSSLRELVSPSGAKTMALSSGGSSGTAVAAIDAVSALAKSDGGESSATRARARAAAVEAEDEEAESFDYMPDLEVERLRRLDDEASEEAAAVALAIAQGEDSSSSALVAVPLDASYLPVDVLHDLLTSGCDAEDYVGEGGSGRGIEWLFQDDPTTREPPIAPAAPFCSNPVTGLRIWQHERPAAGSVGSAEPAASRTRLPMPSLDRVSRAVAQEAAVGAVAFWHRDLVTAIDTPLPLKPQLQVLGGSCLERETVLLTLIEAAVRSSAPRKPESLLPSGEERDETHEQTFRSFVATASPGEEVDIGSDHASIGVGAYVHPDDRSQGQDEAPLPPTGVTGLALARALLAERTALKTGSAQAWVRYAVVLERLGDHVSADVARRTAYALGIGQGGAGAN